MLRIHSKLRENVNFQNNSKILILDINNSNMTKKLYLTSKITVPNHSKLNFATFLVDSGCDCNLLDQNTLYKLFPHLKDNQTAFMKSDIKLQSFTEHPINVLFKVELLIKFENNKIFYPLVFHIMENNFNCPAIIGLKGLASLKLNLIFNEIDGEAIPSLQSFHYNETRIHTLYYTDYELSLGYGEIKSCKGNQLAFVEIFFDHFFNIQVGDKILLSEDFTSKRHNFEIIDTTAIIEFCPKTNKLFSNVLIRNLSKHDLNTNIAVYYEKLNDSEIINITPENIHSLKNVNFIHNAEITQIPKCESTEGYNISKFDNTILNVVDKTVNSITYNLHSNAYTIGTIFPYSVDYTNNPKAENNDVHDLSKSLTDSRINLPKENDLTPEVRAQFESKKDCVQMGIGLDIDDKEFNEVMNAERGIGIPKKIDVPPREIVDLDSFEPLFKPYVEDIFCKKYPQILSRFSLDRGFLSQTLGKYTVKLKPNVQLPSHKKIYYLSPVELTQLSSILEFLLKNGTIERAHQQGDKISTYCSPSYIISRKNSQSSPRLVINYSKINECIQAEPAHIPNYEILIHTLRDYTLFSVLDLSCAFYSICIDEMSKEYTAFSTPMGVYSWNSLGTGLLSSPETLARFGEKMVHYVPERDKKGNEIYGTDKLPKLVYSPLEGTHIIFDDVIVGSKMQGTFKESVHHHFNKLEELVKRIAYHRGKIGFAKAQLCKSRINFFGLFIQNNFISVDPKRTEKLLQAEMPTSPKGIRSFLGLVNSIRTSLGFNVLKNLPILNKLTSSKLRSFTPTKEEEKAFYETKVQLTSAPIFTKISDPNSAKILFTDMSIGDTAVYSAILCQVVKPMGDKHHVKYYINLDDRNHRIIYTSKLPIRPIDKLKPKESFKDYKLRLNQQVPPPHLYLQSETYGWDELEASNSLGHAFKLLHDLHNCASDFSNYSKLASEYIYSSIIQMQMQQFVYNDDRTKFKNFIKDLKLGKWHIDEYLYIFKVIAKITYRQVIVVSYHSNHKEVNYFNSESTKPPFIFLLYSTKGKYYVLPAIIDKVESYNVAEHRGNFEIISYLSKNIQNEHKSKHIYDLELYGLLFALNTFKKFINSNETCVLTDSKCIFYLFTQSNLETSLKLTRWNKKLLEDFPNVVLKFLNSEHNLSDFLSRRYNVKEIPRHRLHLTRYVSTELDKLIPYDRVFTWEEWSKFCNENESCMVDKISDIKGVTIGIKSLTLQQKGIDIVFNPINALKTRISLQNIITAQKSEYREIYEKCLSLDTPYKIKTKDKLSYVVKNSLLFVIFKDDFSIEKIYLPQTMVPPFVAYSHLISNHAGITKMQLILDNFYHPTLNSFIKRLVQSCFSCSLVNIGTKSQKLGFYPVAKRPFCNISLDLIEDLPKSGGYKHILTVTDELSGAIYLYPLKTKKSKEFFNLYFFSIHQYFKPSIILSDNGKVFQHKKNMRILASMGTRFIPTASWWSQSRGLVESSNKIMKNSIKKLLVTQPDYDWPYSLPILTYLYNTTPTNKTKAPPNSIIFGPTSHQNQPHFDALPTKDFHPLIAKNPKLVNDLNLSYELALNEVRHEIEDEKKDRNEALNATKIEKKLEVGGLVLVTDRTTFPGMVKAFRPKYQYVPFRVLNLWTTTVLVEKITDTTSFKLSKNDVKIYHPLDKNFENLPTEVVNVLKNPQDIINNESLSIIMQNDKFEPLNISLHNTEQENEIEEITSDNEISSSDNNDSSSEDDISSSDEDSQSINNLPLKARVRKNPKKKIQFDL